MPATQALRRRIKSVRSTRQITKAMELVAAAKMRRATEATTASRPYVQRAREILADLTKRPLEGITHTFLESRPVKNQLIFVISSDRGLAGAYDTNIMKQAVHLMKEAKAEGIATQVVSMGKQAERFFARTDVPLVQSYAHPTGQPTVEDLQAISTAMSAAFLRKDIDRVMVVYTNFHSLLTQEATVQQLLPLQGVSEPTNDDVRTFIYEPTPALTLDAILPRLLEVELYQYVQESLASEYAARRMAMKNASDNASDMIDDLTLTYNGIRQSSITRELAEITGGVAALES